MRDFKLIFLTRDGCHLCDAAWPLVESAAAEVGAEIEVIDVDSSSELAASYGTRVPVLLGPDDDVIAEGIIADSRQLTRRVRRSTRGGR